MDAGRHFQFRNIQIFKSQSLGVGSYGAVYRARCDQLPCAAKLLHPILVEPGAPRNQQRFEQECQFLNGIRHPHIVQYLGTCRDPETGLQVLLMELMDSNLTHFLEKSQERLPYHLEVNLCHDVALALSYLHSNGIVHRDLSSNNVLLITGSRAKVTDFGMSKLIDATPRMTPFTQCPGTSAYMAPEAVRETPTYTNKLDCFAHGVLAIQIMTREFPDPSQATQPVNDPRSPTGTVLMPVLEPERRKSDIDHIDPHHPLLPITIHCLSYNERDRPTAQQLCNQLVALKEAAQYVMSMRHPLGRVTGQQEDQCLREVLEQATHDIQHRDGRIKELQRNVTVCEWEIKQLQELVHKKDAAVVTSQQSVQRLLQDTQRLIQDNQRLIQDNQRLTQDNQRLTQDNQQLTQDTQRLTQDNQRLTQDNKRLTQDKQQLTQDNHKLTQDNQQVTQDNQELTKNNQQLTQDNQQLTKNNQQLTQDNQQLTQDNQQLTQDNQQLTQDNQQLRHEVREKDNRIEGWKGQLQDNEYIIAVFQQTLVEKEQRIRELEETIPAKERGVQEQTKPKPPSLPPLRPKRKAPPPPPLQQQKRSEASNKAVDIIKLNRCADAPCKMSRGSAAVYGNMTYFSPGGISSIVHAYDSNKEVWSQMPECSRRSFILAIVKGLLTVVGGYQSGAPTNTLLNLTGEGSRRKWSEHFPPMSTKRCVTAVVCSGRSLVVAGGTGDSSTRLSTVEVMDTESLQWFTASSLPYPLSSASATICGENLYLLGGYDHSGDPTQAVFTCSLSALLRTCQSQSLGPRLKKSLSLPLEPIVWNRVTNIPVNLSTCITLCGQLVAVGGQDSDLNLTTAIRKYDPVKNTWTVIGHMATPRFKTLVAVLPGDRLMVVGGYTTMYISSESDVVEIATVV